MKTKIFLSLILFSSMVSATTPQYSISLLPTDPLEAEVFVATDINDSGQIVGAFKAEGKPFHAFISSEINGSREITDLGVVDNASGAFALGINNSGQVIGELNFFDSNSNPIARHSFVTNKINGEWVMTDLTPSPEVFLSSAKDINDAGELVGFIQLKGKKETSVFVGIPNKTGWNVIDIGFPYKLQGSSVHIDNTGRIFLSSSPFAVMASRQDNGWDFQQIKSLDERFKIKGHNNNNQLIGSISNSVAFVATLNNGDWLVKKLNALGLDSASGINDKGQIVGHTKVVDTGSEPSSRAQTAAVLLSEEEELYDLQSLVVEGIDGWSRLSKGFGINNSGQIIGLGDYNGKEVPFILTPINQDVIVPPVCELGVHPQQIKKGEGVGLWWWSDAVTSGNIDNGIGVVSKALGYKWIYPTETTTYTLTAKGENGTTTTCATKVIVEGQIEANPPFCEMGADPEVIKLGEGSALWWWTEGVSSATIDKRIGAVTTPSDYTWFYPTATSTYTMNAVSDSGATTSCKVTIKVIK